MNSTYIKQISKAGIQGFFYDALPIFFNDYFFGKETVKFSFATNAIAAATYYSISIARIDGFSLLSAPALGCIKGLSMSMLTVDKPSMTLKFLSCVAEAYSSYQYESDMFQDLDYIEAGKNAITIETTTGSILFIAETLENNKVDFGIVHYESGNGLMIALFNPICDEVENYIDDNFYLDNELLSFAKNQATEIFGLVKLIHDELFSVA